MLVFTDGFFMNNRDMISLASDKPGLMSRMIKSGKGIYEKIKQDNYVSHPMEGGMTFLFADKAKLSDESYVDDFRNLIKELSGIEVGICDDGNDYTLLKPVIEEFDIKINKGV